MRVQIGIGLALMIGGLVILAAIPIDISHTRCLVPTKGDETAAFFKYVTRDDLAHAGASDGLYCVQARFRRQWGVEELIDP